MVQLGGVLRNRQVATEACEVGARGGWRRQDETREEPNSHSVWGCKDAKLCDRLRLDKQAAESPETARPATFDVKPGWDANGSETR